MDKSIIVYKNSYILTKNGYNLIEDLDINTKIEIWDGNNWQFIKIKQYDSDLDNIINKPNKILLSDGCELLYHNSLSLNIINSLRSNSSADVNKIKINDLKIGDLLYTYNFPEIEGKDNILYPYTHGYYCGCANKVYDEKILMIETDLIYIKLIGDKQKLRSYIDISGKYTFNGNKNRLTGLLKVDMDKKIRAPINGNIENKILWLGGLVDNNGFITKLKDAKYLNISVLTKKFATEIKFLFNTLGINPHILLKSDIRKIKLTSSSINEVVKHFWVITLNADDTNKIFIHFNLKLHYLVYDKLRYSIDQDINRYLTIKKINTIQIKRESYVIEGINACIINGVLIN